MNTHQPRRCFLKSLVAVFAFGMVRDAARLGIMCQFEPEETGARNVLAAARQSGFRRAQIYFPWDRASSSFLGQLPGWLHSEDIHADVVSAYVNCVAPENVLMNARAGDLVRALDLASSVGATRLVAWTGGYGKGLMTPDPRNMQPKAFDGICRFLEPLFKRLETNRLILALESYITLACPDGPTLRGLLHRLPPFVTAVLDPPNLTPITRYRERDHVLLELFRELEGRIGVVHLKDFRLAKDGNSYELPGPMEGEMNYSLFIRRMRQLPPDIPWVAEHLAPAEFAAAFRKLLPMLGG
jgi:sugar phosphate isomerase/epimerase